MAVSQALLTVAEFEKLPPRADGGRQELHHGEVFEMPPVKLIHTRMQKLLVSCIESVASADFAVFSEFPFRPLPEFQVWVADVAAVRRAQLDECPNDGYFVGVPAIVIEILSPSNTAEEMADREAVCLQNGAQEFWLLDPKRKTLRVATSKGELRYYGQDGQVPVAGGVLDLAPIFALGSGAGA